MLSSVLRSDRAVQVNIAIMRAFPQLRVMLATQDLRRKISEMEKRYDAKFRAVFSTLRQMLRDANSVQTADRISLVNRAMTHCTLSGPVNTNPLKANSLYIHTLVSPT